MTLQAPDEPHRHAKPRRVGDDLLAAAGQCKIDLKATFADDTTATWSGINVCDNSYVTIKYSAAGAPVFTAN